MIFLFCSAELLVYSWVVMSVSHSSWRDPGLLRLDWAKSWQRPRRHGNQSQIQSVQSHIHPHWLKDLVSSLLHMQRLREAFWENVSAKRFRSEEVVGFTGWMKLQQISIMQQQKTAPSKMMLQLINTFLQHQQKPLMKGGFVIWLSY